MSVGGLCAAAPTVQFQARGLATAGVAPVTPASPATINLYLSVQERGAGATARAAGVTLGNVQSVATQPPPVCYGPVGPMRW